MDNIKFLEVKKDIHGNDVIVERTDVTRGEYLLVTALLNNKKEEE